MAATMTSTPAPPRDDLLTVTELTSFEQAQGLIEAVQRLSMARSLDEVQSVVRHAARELTGADGATFVLRESDHCHYADEDAISPLWKGQRFPLNSCVSGWVMRERRPVAIEDIYEDDRVPHDAYRPTFVRSLAMVPIRTLDPVGAIGNYWARPYRPNERQLELLQALADSTAVALENVHVLEELEQARVETLRRLALAAEYRDQATYEHTERVARTTFHLAERIGVPAAEARVLCQAATLHDVGKLAVPDALLLKPGRLTDEEFERIKEHPLAGSRILAGSRSAVLRSAEAIALSHHEWWDGSGYPRGLVGEAIPLGGRIVAIADVFDALTHTRPYKEAWSLARARGEILRLSGRQFDPTLVEAFGALDAAALLEPVREDDGPCGCGPS